MHTWTFRKRALATAIALSAIAGSGMALADPVDDLMARLFPIDNVRARGIGPNEMILSWRDRSLPESAFRIEVALDEAGPYSKLKRFAPKCDNAVSPQASGDIGAPRTCATLIQVSEMPVDFNVVPADTRTFFFRVVPIVELPSDLSKPEPGQGQLILEGKPSPADPALWGALRPTDLVCNGGGPDACVNVTSVTLTWTDNSDESEFWVMRARGSSNPNFGTTPYKILDADTTTFHEDIAEFGAVFTYKVVAVRRRTIPRLDGSFGTPEEKDELSFSDSGATPTGSSKDVVTVPVEIAPIPAPSDPTGLSAQFIAPSTAKLTWTDQANPGLPYIDEDGWFIEIGPRSDAGPSFKSQWTAPGAPGPGTRTYSDKTFVPDTVRCYRVRGYRFGPAYSNYTYPPACLGALPKAPSALVAVALSNAEVKLTWKDNSDIEEVFIVERRCDAGTCNGAQGIWVEIVNDVPLNSTTYTDQNTLSLTTYSYRVLAKNSTGKSAPSNIAVVATPPAPVVKPSNLTAEGRVHAIFLSWTDNATNETGYRVEFRPRGADWEILADIPANSTAYLDTDSLGLKQTRCYRVRALKGSAVSDPSNEACATTLDRQLPNGAPSDVAATVQSNTSIVLTWTDSSSNETAFRIEVAVAGNLHCDQAQPAGLGFRLYANVKPVNPTTNRPYDTNTTGPRAWTITGLVPHSAYFFRVRAINPDGESDFGLANPPAGTSDLLKAVTACALTFGPPRPVYLDPDQDNEINALRCDFTIGAPRGEHDMVGGLLVYAISYVPGSDIAHTDALFVTAPGGTVPGDHNGLTPEEIDAHKKHNHFVVMPEFKKANEWTIHYQFRRGFNYKLLTTAYLQAAPYWSSAQVYLRDVKVLADCPTDGL